MEKSLRLTIDPRGAEQGGRDAARFARLAADAARDAQSAFKRLSTLIGQVNRSLATSSTRSERAARSYGRLRNEVRLTDRAMRDMNLNVQTANSGFGRMGHLMSLVAVGFAGKEILQAADEYTNLSNRLAVVSKEGADVAASMKLMGDIAFESRTSLEGTVDVYSKLLRATEDTNVSQKELAAITMTVSKAASMGATSVSSTNASLLQFGQAMSNNWQASAQEMNSIIEQTPGLAKAMADGLTMLGDFGGVGVGNLKKLGEAGLLSTKKMMEALKLASQSVEGDFSKATYTMAQGWQQVRNAMILVTGDMDTIKILTTAITKAFVSLAGWLKENGKVLDTVLKTLLSFGAGLAVILSIVAATKLWAAGQVALNAIMAVNPIFLLATVILGVSAAMVTYLNLLDDEVSVRSDITKATEGNIRALNSLTAVERKGATMRLQMEKTKLQSALNDQENYSARMKALSALYKQQQLSGDIGGQVESSMKMDKLIADRKVYNTELDGNVKRLKEIDGLLEKLKPVSNKPKAASILEGGTAAEKKRAAREAIKASEERLKAIQTHNRMQVEMQNQIRESFDKTAKESLPAYQKALDGALLGYKDYAKDIKTINESLQESTSKIFKGMEDALVTFATTGKLSFTDMANSIIEDMIRMAIQQSIMKPLSAGIGNFLTTGINSLFSPASTTPTHGQAGFGGTGMNQRAKGGAYLASGTEFFAKGGVPGLSSFSSSVVDRPTQFAVGGAFNNVMGEAGPEAIMPLKRTSSGDLGIQVAGGGGGAQTIIIPITIPVSKSEDEGEDRSTQQGQNGGPDIEVIITRVVDGALKGGKFDKSMKNRYKITSRGT